MKKLIAVKLDEEQVQKLEQMEEVTGWSRSEVIRQLIDSGWVKPPAVGSELVMKTKKLEKQTA